jgi:hypothetical protein
MSALEFGEWFVYLSREELLPEAERIRHAQLRAAVYTGPAKAPDAARGWSYTDLTEPNAWPPIAPPMPPKSIAQQVAELNGMRK